MDVEKIRKYIILGISILSIVSNIILLYEFLRKKV